MTDQEKLLLQMGVKYFQMLHATLSDFDSRIRTLEHVGARFSTPDASVQGLQRQLSAIEQEILKILKLRANHE